MINPSDIEKKTMTQEKRKMAKNDYIAYYFGRKLSYILTIPFLYFNISPNVISIISMVPILIGFFLFLIGHSSVMFFGGWVFLFLWNLIDGVDGNVARYKEQYSAMGSVYDAMSGYLAMVMTFFAAGLGAAHQSGVLIFWGFNAEFYIICGALSGILVIFPRLIMQKAIVTLGNSSGVSSVKDKATFGFFKVIALNLSSVTGGAQFLLLLAVLFNLLDIYTIFYLFFNMAIAVVSLISIFREE
ncbi:CDP-alcohol phosphatidyltransferase family protein [Liquorilactobacillus mali]|uniref:CDP-alcohol phosphatidyltransferase family protein n=1 Tax=Liquorilactobacillus mali TaxID=1618 RepID=UPI00264EDD61|nr:CDP-alcohol phosphatidyltransferase family protein [Liquorilactobacillus mali]MDN7145080.1 CDP-alcohol phosphatidyltransferase family protein [Liquorilactobacillus mali]